ncbi:MAG: type 1 periplasmic-binding domain-containing protein [Acidimicrobiales bacterium]
MNPRDMTPLQQFRVWLRRSTVGARAATATAAVLAAALLVWLVTPVHDTSQVASGGERPLTTAASSNGRTGGSAGIVSGSGASKTGARSPGSAGSAPGTGTSGVASGTGASGGVAANAGSPGAAPGCVSPPGSAPGITATQINVAVSLLNIYGPAGNSTFGVPSVQEQQQDYEQVIADTNAHGGVACRKLVATYYQVNNADQSDQQQKCLDMIQAKPFAVIDLGAYLVPVSSKECFAVQGPLPYFGNAGLIEPQMTKYFPYLMTLAGTWESLLRDTAHGLAAQGAFDPAKGFKKLGMVYKDCPPELPKAMIDDLHAVGLTDSQIVTYDIGCPSIGLANPSDIQQAILKFKTAGVSHVTLVNEVADFDTLTRQSQQQGFKPRWVIPDEGEIAITHGNLAPDYDNIANAIAISQSGYGQENTNLPLSPGTARCNAIFKAVKRPDVYQQPTGAGGVACSEIWMFKAAVEHAPSIGRTTLAQGLQSAGLIEVSWPSGDTIRFRSGRNTGGGGFWRPLQFFRDCTCWKPLDAFRPSLQ